MLKMAAETKLVIITHCSSIYVRVCPRVLRFPSRVLRPSPCFTAPCIRVTISARFLMYKCPEIQKYKTLVYCRYRKRSLTFQAYALCERETRFSNISLWRAYARNVRLRFLYRQCTNFLYFDLNTVCSILRLFKFKKIMFFRSAHISTYRYVL